MYSVMVVATFPLSQTYANVPLGSMWICKARFVHRCHRSLCYDWTSHNEHPLQSPTAPSDPDTASTAHLCNPRYRNNLLIRFATFGKPAQPFCHPCNPRYRLNRPPLQTLQRSRPYPHFLLPSDQGPDTSGSQLEGVLRRLRVRIDTAAREAMRSPARWAAADRDTRALLRSEVESLCSTLYDHSGMVPEVHWDLEDHPQPGATALNGEALTGAWAWLVPLVQYANQALMEAKRREQVRGPGCLCV